MSQRLGSSVQVEAGLLNICNAHLMRSHIGAHGHLCDAESGVWHNYTHAAMLEWLALLNQGTQEHKELIDLRTTI